MSDNERLTDVQRNVLMLLRYGYHLRAVTRVATAEWTLNDRVVETGVSCQHSTVMRLASLALIEHVGGEWKITDKGQVAL